MKSKRKIKSSCIDLYNMVIKFKKKYPTTLSFRIMEHCRIIDKHLNDGELIKYAFTGQKNDRAFDVFNSYVVALTNKRILLARKRMLFGYFFFAITPDMFNDLEVKARIFWGQVIIDTVKEVVKISNVSKKALAEIETEITEYMMEEKRKFGK